MIVKQADRISAFDSPGREELMRVIPQDLGANVE